MRQATTGASSRSYRRLFLAAAGAGATASWVARVDAANFTWNNPAGGSYSIGLNWTAANFNGTNKTWLQGDYNYDRNVDLTDFTFLASNFNKSLPGAAMTNIGTPVPEPGAAIAYLATAAIALTHTRRRRRSPC